MKKQVLIVTALLIFSALVATGLSGAGNNQDDANVVMYAHKNVYDLGEPVTLTIKNVGSEPIRTRPVENADWIEQKNGFIVHEQYPAQPFTPLEYLQPGESYSWMWDQTYLKYDWSVPSVPPIPTIPPTGDQVQPRRYVAKLEWFYDFGTPGGGLGEAEFTIRAHHMPYETIDQGWLSYYQYGTGFNGEFKVIRDQQEWEDFWADHKSGMYPRPPVPEVNFNRDMVLVALMGNFPSSGYGISIEHTAKHGQTLTAYYHQVFGPGMLPVVTNPYHIILVHKAHNVEWVEI
jgi:hypothetical protein